MGKLQKGFCVAMKINLILLEGYLCRSEMEFRIMPAALKFKLNLQIKALKGCVQPID